MAWFERLRTPTQAQATPGPGPRPLPVRGPVAQAAVTAPITVPLPAPSRTLGGGQSAQLSIGAGLHLHLREPLHAGSLRLDGALDGQLHLQHFTQGRSGSFRGSVHCQSAQLRGVFDGDLCVQGRLTVFAGAQVTGRVHCNDVVVWHGATLQAQVLGLDPLAAAGEPASAGRPRLMLLPG